MGDQKTLREFCNAHQIRVLDTNKRAHKATKINTAFFKNYQDYNIVYQDHVVFETEPMYTLEIAESELQKIADFESQVFNHLKTQGHYNMFETIMAQKEQEKYLKNKYPAVKKAYEHYSLMLKMAEGGEL